MSFARRQSGLSRDEFLDWVQTQEARYEFDGTAPVAMGGSTADHSRIAQNLWRAMDRQLAGTGCEAFIQDGAVATIGEATRFPDVTVTCSPFTGKMRVIQNPVLVCEVLSPSTSLNDRIDKLEEYRAVPSIEAYVILEQDIVAVTVYRRQPDGVWSAQVLKAVDIFTHPLPPLAVPLSEIYAGIG